MKKKMILILLAIAMLSTMFVGCGNDNKTNPNENEVLDTGVPNTDTSTPDTNTDTSTPEKTPIVEGVFFEHKNGWYRCEPLENGLYKYEIYSADMNVTYSIELPVFSEDMDFQYLSKSDKNVYMAFSKDDFYFDIETNYYPTGTGIFEVKKENYGYLTKDFAGEAATFFEHIVDTPDMDVYMWNIVNSEDNATIIVFYEYDYTLKYQTMVSIQSYPYTEEEHITYAKTWSKTQYESEVRYKNNFSTIDSNVTTSFGLNDISSKVKEKNLNLNVVGNYDWNRTDFTDPTLYKKLTLALYLDDYNTIPSDTIKEVFEELFGKNELYIYGTEDKLSELPTTFTMESIPYFYYYVDENLYGVVSISDAGVLEVIINYYKK